MHTPGPWVVEHDGHRPPGSRSKRNPIPTMVMVVAEKGGMPGVMVSQGVVESRDFDNARLIAAAPDLLEALEWLLEQHTQLVNSGDCGNWDPEKDEYVIAARAAIAKAESK